MKQFSEVCQTLQQRLEADFPEHGGMQSLTLSFTPAGNFSLLEWLSAQSLYPKFYWRQRDNQEEVAVCGYARRYTDSHEAWQNLQTFSEKTARIWGMNAFDQVIWRDKSIAHYLFLPRLELIKKNQSLTLRLYLADPHSLQQDAQRARYFLAALQPARRIAPLSVELITKQHLPDRVEWDAMIERALHTIERGEMAKVALARKTTLTLAQPLDVAAFLAASRRVNRHCYHFMLALSDDEAFLGASPECLFHRQKDALTTEALAGTVANVEEDDRAQELAQWLLADSKNQHENWLVVDDICQRIQGAVLDVDVLPAEVVRLRKVQHLRRVIQCRLNQVNDADTLTRLQPTAAVAGLPRAQARQFISQNEPFSRGWYAGSAGYISLQQTELTVALRSARVEQHRVHLYAGAGIVAGSSPHQEWEEIENKAAGLISLLEPK